jgi:curved DNA-binding protein CbpA
MNQTENLYNILEIKKESTQNEIRIAYKKLALQWLEYFIGFIFPE